MILNATNLQTVFTGFKATFQEGLGEAANADHLMIAERVPSSTGTEEYGWLGELPGVREWIGDRHIHRMKQNGYRLTNRDYELTVEVDRNAIEDDSYGVYAPRFRAMGRSVGYAKPNAVWDALVAGFSTVCYDGQFFFDTDHPVLDANGVVQNVSNTGGGSGSPWFLLDVRQAVKPLILQERKEFAFDRLDAPTDMPVFFRKAYTYGSDARYAVGYGFWQMAYGSRQALTDTNYWSGRTVLGAMRGDHGQPLGISGNLLVVGPSNERAARKLLENEYAAGGESNESRGTAQLLVVPRLG
jgi:phage major head subunit gpT-like protein